MRWRKLEEIEENRNWENRFGWRFLCNGQSITKNDDDDDDDETSRCEHWTQ